MGKVEPRPFTLQVPEAEIADLRARLARTRWPDEPPLAPWSTGASLSYVREITDTWRRSTTVSAVVGASRSPSRTVTVAVAAPRCGTAPSSCCV